MNLYLITQSENTGYDTYDSAVVSAESESEARRINPSGDIYQVDPRDWSICWAWATTPDNVTAELIGLADPSITQTSVILASFNAG